jgi:hypothetical protein
LASTLPVDFAGWQEWHFVISSCTFEMTSVQGPSGSSILLAQRRIIDNYLDQWLGALKNKYEVVVYVGTEEKSTIKVVYFGLAARPTLRSRHFMIPSSSIYFSETEVWLDALNSSENVHCNFWIATIHCLVH